MNVLLQLLLAVLNLVLIMALLLGIIEIFGASMVAMVVFFFFEIVVFAWITRTVKTKKPVDKQS